MSKLPSLLFLIYQTPHRANGGVESITEVLMNITGFDLHVITQRESEKTALWRSRARVTVIPGFDQGDRFKKVLGFLKTNRRVYLYCKKNQIELVHCNDQNFMFNAAMGVKSSGARLIYNIRSLKEPHQSYGRKWKLSKKYSDHMIMLSREMMQGIRERLEITESPTTNYIYSMVDFQKLFPMKKNEVDYFRGQQGLNPDQPVVGFVGNFIGTKRQKEFLDLVVPKLVKAYPTLMVYLVGDFHPDLDEYAHSCLEVVQKHQLEGNVTMTGYQEEMGKWYNLFDVTLATSVKEGLPRSMIESISCGTTMVSFEVCSVREILEENQCGEVVPNGDYELIAAKTIELLGNRQQMTEFGLSGARVSKRLFHRDAVIPIYVETYQSVINARPVSN